VTPVVEAVDVYRFYHANEDETLALRGVSMHVGPGEMVALLGPSGSGKSTLLACLAGLDEPDGGYVALLGERLTRRPESQRAARRAAHVGVLLQSANLLDHLNVEQNVALPLRLAGTFTGRRVDELVDQVGLTHRRRAYPSQLSGGEAARASLAAALACAPSLLLADEPTGEVDAQSETHLLTLLEAHRAAGGAVIVATHSDALAGRANRVVRLHAGCVVDA